MKIVTVGTGMIVEEFIKAAKQVDIVEIVGSFSRTLEGAKEFSNKMGIKKSFDSFSTISEDDEVNTVYIATPNALHYSHAKFFLENGKNVIIEKPIMSSVEHAIELLALAKENNLFIFEAISNIHTPNFEVIKEYVNKIGDIKMVTANYSQYSSRYTLFKQGGTPNVFNPEFSGGVLMDLNIYNIQLIYNLFGLPEKLNYFPNIERGIDTSGVLIMDYGKYIATSMAAKDSASMCFFQVQGDEGYIVSKGPTNELPNLYIKTKDEEFEVNHNTKHRLYSEIVEFGRLFRAKDLETTYQKFDNSIDVLGILEEAINQTEIKFADK